MRGTALILAALLTTAAHAIAQTTTSSVSYSTPDHGGTVIETAGGTDRIVVGYGRVQPSSSTTGWGCWVVRTSTRDTLGVIALTSFLRVRAPRAQGTLEHGRRTVALRPHTAAAEAGGRHALPTTRTRYLPIEHVRGLDRRQRLDSRSRSPHGEHPCSPSGRKAQLA